MSDFLPTRCQGVSRFFASHATQLAQLCLVRISPSSLQVFAPPALPWLGLPPHHTTTQPDTPAWHLSFPPSRLVLFGPDHTTLFPSSPYEYTLRWCVGHHLGKDRAEPDQNLSPLPSLMPLPAAPAATLPVRHHHTHRDTTDCDSCVNRMQPWDRPQIGKHALGKLIIGMLQH
jgi:hypothetical protein